MNNCYVGIDLGTTNSVVSFADENYNIHVFDDEGSKLVPSVVTIKGTDVVVGREAKSNLKIGDKNTFGSFKINMGTNKIYKMEDSATDPIELSAHVLNECCLIAEEKLGVYPEGAVVTVPAHFIDVQMEAVREACEMIGLNLLYIMREPTASALTYCFDHMEDERRESFLVYDFGGGTFDVTYLVKRGNKILVKETRGDILGGDDIDRMISEMMTRTLTEKKLILSKYERNILKEIAEEIKIKLSYGEKEVSINYTDYLTGKEYSILGDSKFTLSREKYNIMLNKILDKTIELSREVFDETGAIPDMLLFAGGTTKDRYIRDYVINKLGVEECPNDVDPDLSISMGAALKARQLAERGEGKFVLTDILPHSIGIELNDGSFKPILYKGCTVPTRSNECYFQNVYKGMDNFKFNVYQGESEVATKNTLIGELVLKSKKIADLPKGGADIRVSAKIDERNLVTLLVREVNTGVMKTSNIYARGVEEDEG